MITQDYLRSILEYNQDTGIFTWIFGNNRRVRAGDVAGCIDKDGYIQIRVCKKLYRAHRLAWLYMNGMFPESHIDHIDNNRTNNSLSNLRLANYTKNNWNACISKNSTSGVKGVNWDNRANAYKARVMKNGKLYHFGSFRTIEEASIAVKKGREYLHGEFTNHGD